MSNEQNDENDLALPASQQDGLSETGARWAAEINKAFEARRANAIAFGRTVYAAKSQLGHGGWSKLFQKRQLHSARRRARNGRESAKSSGQVLRILSTWQSCPAGLKRFLNWQGWA